MWTKALGGMLTHMFRHGELKLTLADGTVMRFGDGAAPHIALTFHDPSLPRKVIMSPDLAVGEAYMDGRLTIEDDNLRGFLSLAISNMSLQGQPWFRKPLVFGRHILRNLHQFNPAAKAQANVAHHYDLSGALYDLFLDEDRQYSCAYFSSPNLTLEQAQNAKKHHIARKLRIEPGMRVLDIGCGWGGMGLTLARDYGAQVVGVTLSREQHQMANQRAKNAGLEAQAHFELMDYRHIDGQFDRIVSVGMFEHVGAPHYAEYFRTVRERLTENGVALIHTIGRSEPPGTSSPWITKYIFPGGYVPALSETARAIESTDLYAIDVEIWRLHYAETLRHWQKRFEANIDTARALYDERFCRMWRYYLIASEMTFRMGRQVVFQFQLSPKQDAVPLTRDYLYPAKGEEQLKAAE
ncbi:Cyclopropane-fatty-acyl-phospholipid synthase [Roseovarius albus]|uniref:Cyclopropane-fatty-acyl-phospholipid synthase n=1 Tax=Roseovarius albus TaxID=1247867 RepID=A0A1X7A2F1_9RHOB|nr:cyclopropane-fatty-acyl-phospholipid synthase family protein [Roseovarius albus]SLN68640.1 Cyclopropane-fatty-acyl-phospholipid synthase [Roseovarius albus]